MTEQKDKMGYNIMKIRTDFVTNSSSSSFHVLIEFQLKNGKKISYSEVGVDDEGEPVVGQIFLDASPKQLGVSKNIQEMISLLKKSVHDEDWHDSVKNLFDAEDPMVQRILDGTVERMEERECWKEFRRKEREAHQRAQDFIHELEQLTSMEEIQSIRIDGDQCRRNGDDYYKAYKYNLQTDEYICSICDERETEQTDGGIGGELCFSDEEEAKEVDGSDVCMA